MKEALHRGIFVTVSSTAHAHDHAFLLQKILIPYTPVRPRLGDAGEETADLEPLADREEPVEQAALVHHLDAAHVQAERAGLHSRLRQLLQHKRVHTVQPQLAGQHQAGRSTASNYDVDHHNPPFRRLRFCAIVNSRNRTDFSLTAITSLHLSYLDDSFRA